jgi:AbrB family looped-hinge helix DNA binding protein
VTFIATVTSKGQMTLPAKLRAELGIEAGDRVELTLADDGTVRLRKRSRSFSELKGLVKIEGSARKIEDWIAEARASMASEGLE